METENKKDQATKEEPVEQVDLDSTSTKEVEQDSLDATKDGGYEPNEMLCFEPDDDFDWVEYLEMEHTVVDDGTTSIYGTEKSKAQMFQSYARYFAEVTNPESNLDNFFKSKYAPLSEVLNAIRPVMGKYGIGITQPSRVLEDGRVSVQTILMHESGAYMAFPALTGKPTKPDIQGVGAVTTYLRRFSLNSISGVCGEIDDDGTTAAGLSSKKTATAAKKTPLDKARADLIEACAKFTNNDAAKRKQVCDALDTIVAKGNVNNIKTEADIKKALEIVKNLS